MKPQVNPIHYKFRYDYKARFICYWYQINEIIETNPDNILEIGIGNKLVSTYLEMQGYNILTIDIDKRLKPNIVSNVTKLPFYSDSFSTIACFEVLEHLPFEKFGICLKEIGRVAKKFVIISIPDIERTIRLKIPIFGDIMIPFHRIRKIEHNFDGEHHWEINKKNYELEKIINKIKDSGLKIIRTYRIFENPYHRFFILSK